MHGWWKIKCLSMNGALPWQLCCHSEMWASLYLRMDWGWQGCWWLCWLWCCWWWWWWSALDCPLLLCCPHQDSLRVKQWRRNDVRVWGIFWSFRNLTVQRSKNGCFDLVKSFEPVSVTEYKICSYFTLKWSWIKNKDACVQAFNKSEHLRF